ncbi:hypothetical protein, partial [Porphyromonas gingivicanis]|uniref:hypothetical protein n=1 Tax=Porphyromonas gingivicanis TaxID=266762 RepID=UPI0005606E34
MIYLRAAKKIYSKHKQNAEEEESYTHLLPQGWTLLLESTNGVHFNQGLQETTLNARLFSANGIDFTSQLRDITPLWSVTDSEWTATGWEVNLRKEDLPGVSIYASIVCKINFADVLRHFPFLPPVLVNIYQDKEIKGELSVYNPYSILTIIPDSFSVASVLAKDELFKVSVRGEKGDPGKSV